MKAVVLNLDSPAAVELLKALQTTNVGGEVPLTDWGALCPALGEPCHGFLAEVNTASQKYEIRVTWFGIEVVRVTAQQTLNTLRLEVL